MAAVSPARHYAHRQPAHAADVGAAGRGDAVGSRARLVHVGPAVLRPRALGRRVRPQRFETLPRRTRPVHGDRQPTVRVLVPVPRPLRTRARGPGRAHRWRDPRAAAGRRSSGGARHAGGGALRRHPGRAAARCALDRSHRAHRSRDAVQQRRRVHRGRAVLRSRDRSVRARARGRPADGGGIQLDETGRFTAPLYTYCPSESEPNTDYFRSFTFSIALDGPLSALGAKLHDRGPLPTSDRSRSATRSRSRASRPNVSASPTGATRCRACCSSSAKRCRCSVAATTAWSAATSVVCPRPKKPQRASSRPNRPPATDARPRAHRRRRCPRR